MPWNGGEFLMNYDLQNIAFCQDFIINIESFGGLLFERGGTPAWELDVHHALFLRALQLTGIGQSALSVTHELLENKDFYPAINVLSSLGAVCQKNKNCHQTGNMDLNEATIWIAKELSVARSRSCLKAPTSLTIYPEMRCQQDCAFCFLSSSVKKMNANRNFEYWTNLIREAKGMGVSSISVLGGEPTLYPYLTDIIKVAQEENINIGITSNGLCVADDLIRIVHGHPHSLFCFSLESLNPEIHHRYTGVDNDKVLNTIRCFHEAGIPFNVNTVGMGQSLDELKSIVDFCVCHGAIVWFLNLYYWQKASPKEFPGLYWYARTDKALRQYIDRNHRGRIRYQMFGCQLYWTYDQSRLRRGSKLTNYNHMISGCAAGINQLEILPDGTALPCIQMDAKAFDCGNVFDKGLEIIWNDSNVLNKLRANKSPANSYCAACDWYPSCKGGCKARREYSKRKYDIDIDPRCPRLSLQELPMLPNEERTIGEEMPLLREFYHDT